MKLACWTSHFSTDEMSVTQCIISMSQQQSLSFNGLLSSAWLLSSQTITSCRDHCCVLTMLWRLARQGAQWTLIKLIKTLLWCLVWSIFHVLASHFYVFFDKVFVKIFNIIELRFKFFSWCWSLKVVCIFSLSSCTIDTVSTGQDFDILPKMPSSETSGFSLIIFKTLIVTFCHVCL